MFSAAPDQHNIRETSKSGLATVKGINRTNDYAFKRILGSEEDKEALLGFLNAVLNPPSGREFTYVELLDRELDPASLLDRGARMENPAIRKALTLSATSRSAGCTNYGRRPCAMKSL
ncbi:PD-(D/E)XK nuclease family transposase [Moorella naiadis]|uniref:PD-(D/E)XK nuclease family transposase n=1 Tax=Moorella naiadis (nom. illeg.) TaxID=3093670 RepID=UPI003D9CABD7